MEHRDRDTPRVVKRRVVLAAAAGMAALGGAGLVGSRMLGSMIRWLHGQPAYLTTFAALELQPDPPSWYRGGRAHLLARVREAAGRPDAPFSALDAELGEIDRAFRLFYWVRRVVKVERRWPNRIIVHLDYRRPVARAAVPGKAVPALLDDAGVILPWADVDEQMAARLVPIITPESPFKPCAGHAWMNAEGIPDERVQAAVALAAFLKERLAETPGRLPSGLQPRAIFPVKKNELFLQNGEATLIFWGEAPGVETPGSLTACEKWEFLMEWLAHPPDRPVRKPEYLCFTRAGVVIAREGGRR